MSVKIAPVKANIDYSTNSQQSGPVEAPAKSRYSTLVQKKVQEALKAEDNDDEEDDEVLSEASKELDYDEEDGADSSTSSEEDSDSDDSDDNDDEASDASESAEEEEDEDVALPDAEEPKRDRKRKRNNDNEDLEAKYLAELTKDEDKEAKEPEGKRQKGETLDADEEDSNEEEEPAPVHESLAPASSNPEVEKASCTVFLANVSTEAISSKSARKTLITHLSSALDPHDMPIQKFESIRFRSVAFSTGSMPKRAAYITKSLMESTKSANAYAVFSTPAAARLVASKLNGSEVLGRHIRVDSVAHPSPTDHRRCVFVGNLGFVDDETVIKKDQDGETVEKKRTKVPSDIEEGLWRTFGKKGKVENVRVVRDSKTRVGKGFAYVQFYVSLYNVHFNRQQANISIQDGNDVEAALLLDGKSFAPMLPRKLRVTRAKDPRKTALAQERSFAKANAADTKPRSGGKYIPKMTPEQQAAAGRAGKLFGRARGAGSGPGGQKVVFEGNRASIRDALPKDLKGKKGKGKGKGKGKPQGRGAKRAAEWKKKQA